MLVASVIALVLVGCTQAWVNSYDKQLTFECPPGQYMTRWISKHSNRKEDRVWDFECTTGFVGEECTWSDDANRMDGHLLLECPTDTILAGATSHHSNRREDRVWRYKCCKITSTKSGTNCYWHDYINWWDKPMDFTVPPGTAITGVYSHHRDRVEDRLWYLYLCDFATCIASKITILDDIQPQLTGTRVVGLTTSQGCTPLHTYALHLGNTDIVVESTSIEISKGSEFNWNTEISLTATAKAGFLGNGAEISLGISQSLGGAITAEETNRKSTSTSQESLSEIEAHYIGPAAGLLIADVRQYTVDLSSVNVAVDVVCEDGSKFTKNKKMKLSSKTFGQTHFTTLIGRYARGKCNDDTNDCIRNVQGQHALNHRTVMDDFRSCFANGVGTVSRK